MLLWGGETSASQLLLKVSAFLKYATVSQAFKVKVQSF